MKKINVLHIASIDNRKTSGTSVAVPQNVLSQNDNDKFNVSFFNCSEVEIKCLKELKHNYCKNGVSIFNIIKGVKPDIVVFHELYKPYYLKIYKYLLQHKIPYIIIPHGGMSVVAQNVKALKKKVANALLFNSFFKGAKAIQYLSVSERNISKFNKLNHYVLGNGINNIPTSNLYLSKKNGNYNNQLLKLVYVGRYDYYVKGLDQLLKAALLLKENKIDGVELNLYGRGTKDNEKIISEYIKKNDLGKYVKFHGPLYDAKKREEILKNDVFVQVSRTEGQPLGVMEAMCLGMPVLLSEGTGFKEIIESNKMGINCKTDFMNIYDKIISLKNKMEKLPTYSKNSYLYAIDHYEWNNIINQTFEIYKSIIESR